MTRCNLVSCAFVTHSCLLMSIQYLLKIIIVICLVFCEISRDTGSHHSLAEADLEFLIPFAFISQVLGLEMTAITPNCVCVCVCAHARVPVHVRAGVRDQIQDLF